MSKVPISIMKFSESRYVRGENVWKAQTLYDFAVEKGYATQQIPLFAINLSQFIFQCKRVIDCDYNIPIILDDYGQIADGYHRICKAILEGKETIDAIRLEEMPDCDFVEHK